MKEHSIKKGDLLAIAFPGVDKIIQKPRIVLAISDPHKHRISNNHASVDVYDPMHEKTLFSISTEFLLKIVLDEFKSLL